MAGHHSRYLKAFFTFSALLLLEVCLDDVQALSCQHVLHRKVGDTVEFSSCLPTEGVTEARWKFGKSVIADTDNPVDERQFKGRLKLDPKSFNLTVKDLTLKDSGEFRFLSAGETQRPSVTVTLKVHDSITQQPNLTGNSTWQTSTNSCAVLLQCSVNSDIDVSYKWTAGNEIRKGSRLQYNLRTQDGDTEFSCTVHNSVSEMSASRTMTCTINTQHVNTRGEKYTSSLLVINGPVIGIVLVTLLLISLVCYKKSKASRFNRHQESQTANQDETQLDVYSSLSHGDGCIYETLNAPENTQTDDPSHDYLNVTAWSAHP